jgi:hypothetical protein
MIASRAPMKALLLGLGLMAALPWVTACANLGGGSRACPAVAAPEIEFLKRGYYVVRSRCEYLYCQNGPLTGSQLAVKQCKSAKEMRQNAKDAQEFMDKTKEPRPVVCSSEGCSSA